MTSIIVVRHGTSQWARENRFSGWADAPLSTRGTEMTRVAGRAIRKTGIKFDVCLTSRLQRAQETAGIIADQAGIPSSSIRDDWRLNERHYGQLQGYRRSQGIAEYGNAQVVQWRRSYHNRPLLIGAEPAEARFTPGSRLIIRANEGAETGRKSPWADRTKFT